MRLVQTQVWPAFLNLQAIAPSTALSRSASSKTMNGAWPPSSIEVRLTVSAHCLSRILPTSVEPVNETLRTVLLVHSSVPIGPELPVTTLNTPAGTPARSASSAMARAEKGVAEAGLTTMVQPAANAGPTLRVIMALGKFQGVIAAHTPTGCLITRIRRDATVCGMTSP